MTAAWIAFILYAAVAITLGWRAHRRQITATAADFWTVGRRLDSFYLSSGVLTTAMAFPVAAVFLPRVRPRGVLWSSAAWLADTGLGFILWGILAAGAGYIIGASTYRD